MSTDGQRTRCRRNIAENYNRLTDDRQTGRRQTINDRQTTDGQTTDGQATAYSERERELMFANIIILKNF